MAKRGDGRKKSIDTKIGRDEIELKTGGGKRGWMMDRGGRQRKENQRPADILSTSPP